MIKQTSRVINEYFVNELMQLIEKYNQLEDTLVQKIEIIINCLGIQVKGSHRYSNLNELITFAESIGEEVDEDYVKFYFFVQENIKKIDNNEAEELWHELRDNGFAMLEADDVIMYSNIQYLRDYVENRLDDIMSDSYEIDRLFDKDVLIDYFMEEVSIDTVKREMLEDMDYVEILDIEPELMFEGKNGEMYRYAITA